MKGVGRGMGEGRKGLGRLRVLPGGLFGLWTR